MRSKQALASYQQNKVIAAGTLDNHKMILMLMEGALQKINEAKAGMIKNQIAKKGEAVSAAISILEGLRVSVDPSVGEISTNLLDLYAYMTKTLLVANLNNDISKLDEVHHLLNELKTTWEAIRSEALAILGKE